jgi:hypothetical protein
MRPILMDFYKIFLQKKNIIMQNKLYTVFWIFFVERKEDEYFFSCEKKPENYHKNTTYY